MIIYGVDTKPMIERPVLAHARDALGKAERFAQLSEQTSDDRFEGVIHGAYYAMFHAARAALLAVEGTASANHGQAVETFARMVERRKLGPEASDLAESLTQARQAAGGCGLQQQGSDRTGPSAAGAVSAVSGAPGWSRSVRERDRRRQRPWPWGRTPRVRLGSN